MLKQLRHKKTAKKIWIVLAILILPAFVFWGMKSTPTGKQESKYAGIISGRKIPTIEFQESLDAVKNQAIMQFGEKFSEVQAALNLESQAWDRLILLSEAKRRNKKISDQEVISLIESYPFFQNKGVFDNHTYSQMLQYVFRVQPRLFEEQTRQNLMIAKLYKDETENIKLNDAEIKDEYRKNNEAISVNYLAAIPEDFAKEITLTADELKSYFDKNSFQFKLPLSFNMEYVEIIGINEADDAARGKTKAIFSRLSKKVPFAQVAKDNGLTLKETGLFPETGPIPGIGWSPEALLLINKSKNDQYLNPIHMDKSFFIFRIKERKEPYIPSFESIKDKVKAALVKEKSDFLAQEKIESCMKNIKELLAANSKEVDFNKLGKSFGLKSSFADSFKFGGYIEGVGASDKFWVTADKLKENEISNIINMPSGFYIIRLKSRTPIEEKKFESEKADFMEKLLMQKKQDSFNKFIGELKLKARKN